jgi:hypothetical protein
METQWGVPSHPVGIIAAGGALGAVLASPGRFFGPEGRTWSCEPRGTADLTGRATDPEVRDV